MQQSQSNLFVRDDTFFGVCEALGQDFGFHPNWLRVALAPLLFWNPVATIAGYFGFGLVVLVSRWLHPNPRPAMVGPEQREPAIEAEAAEVEMVPLAA